MIRHLQNEGRKQAALQDGSNARPRLGTVTAYDDVAYAVKVMLEPDGVETGWIPIQTASAGNGWGLLLAPIAGCQARVSFTGGDINQGLVTGFIFSDDDAPPLIDGSGPPPGEMWLKHQAGALLRFLADGTVVMEAPEGMLVRTPKFAVTGDIVAGGNIIDLATVDEVEGAGGSSLNDLRDAYNAHRHGGVSAGDDQTGPTTSPVEEDPEA